jgi:hypothetical protein
MHTKRLALHASSQSHAHAEVGVGPDSAGEESDRRDRVPSQSMIPQHRVSRRAGVAAEIDDLTAERVASMALLEERAQELHAWALAQ